MTGRGKARPFQRVLGSIFAAVALALLANSLFLYGTGTPDRFLAAMARLHVWLGFGLAVALLGFVVPHLVLHLRHRNRRAKGVGAVLLGALVVGSIFGVALHFTHLTAARWLMPWHQILFVAGLGTYLAHRLVARTTPVMRREFAGAVGVLIAVLVLWGLSASQKSRRPNGQSIVARAAAADFGATNARTIDGHWLRQDDLGNPQYCAQCHTEIASQWDGSAHHMSSLNDPFYKATFASLQRNRPMSAAKFCGGCHDPLVMHTGNMEKTVDESTPNALAGITCLGCHAIVAMPDRSGNAGYVVAAPQHYPFYGSKNPDEQEQNRRLIRAKPEQHKASFMKPFFRTSEYCLECHKAHLDVAVNNYRWKRGQNDYDAWFESAVAGKSARTFYTPKETKRCQDCHMPDVPTQDPAAHDGKTRDHTFAGANMALATFSQNQKWAEKTRAMLKDCVTVDLLAAVTDADGPAEKRVYPLEDKSVRLPAGQPVRIDVVVRNRKVGHMFPGGTADLNEAWLDFSVAQPGGGVLFASGKLDATGRLERSAHRFQAYLLTREARKLDIHEVEFFYTTLYANVLQLGNSDIVRYEFVVPAALEGQTLRVAARLKYRKFSREYTEFALGPEGLSVPVIEISADSVDVKVGRALAGPMAGSGEELAMRLNDYGIGHLRQGDTRVARWAFERVGDLLPKYADAWVNQARVDLAEGALERMEAALRHADKLQPGYHKTAWLLGRLRASQGRLEEAVAAYDLVLAKFPEDREILNQKGIALFKQQQFEAALVPLQVTLATDPENVVAHSYIARCCKSLGREAECAEHEAAYTRYRNEERERTATEIHRRNDPDASREADPQHVHVLGGAAPVRLAGAPTRPPILEE